MSLPPIFAIYISNTQTFQFLQTETVENEVKLKTWVPPVKDGLKTLAELDSSIAKSWTSGQEWYVEPLDMKQTDTNPREITVYQTQINNRHIFWWSLNHNLVWSNYTVHSRRFSLGEEMWRMSPSIPILEIAPEPIYPRTSYGFYPRWVTSRSKDLDEISQFARTHLEQHPEYFNTIVKNLKIAVPEHKHEETDEDDYDDDYPYYEHEEEDSRCFASFLLSSIIAFATGLYLYILVEAM
jgi:hypothetical protein